MSIEFGPDTVTASIEGVTFTAHGQDAASIVEAVQGVIAVFDREDEITVAQERAIEDAVRKLGAYFADDVVEFKRGFIRRIIAAIF